MPDITGIDMPHSKEHGNGLDSELQVSSLRAKWRPNNRLGFVIYVFDRYGILFLVCLAMGAFIWWQSSGFQKAAREAHVMFKDSLDAQTAAVKESTAEQRKMTEAVIKMDTRLETHLDEDDRRHR